MVKGTHPVVHADVLALINSFIDLKRTYGTASEQALYKTMNSEQFITRLFHKRCIVFYKANDTYVLRDGQKGRGGFEFIGQENERKPLYLANYLSYDEMKISALIGLSSSTAFINDGARNNRGVPMPIDSFENRGVIIGLVGARFRRPNFMEYHDIVVDKSQNVAHNGFGDESTALAAGASRHSVELNKLWAKFYNLKNLPLYTEVSKDGNYVRCQHDSYLNASAYRKRIQILAETLLLEANFRAKTVNKQGYVYIVGFGLGVWCLPGSKDKIEQLFIDSFGDVVAKLKLSHISTLEFGWISGDISKVVPKNKGIKVILSQRSPQAKLSSENSDKLLIVTYAWDGNSFPGNEYWLGSIASTGDSAAASCSLITELHNPLINPFVSGETAKILDPKKDDD